MRRSRRRNTKKEEKSSSDESDHQNTMDIIDKISKKFLGQSKAASRPLRTMRVSENKSSTPLIRVTRSRSKSRHDVAYEADVDSSADTNSPSATDLYDFDKSNEEDLCLVLFPSKLTSTGKRTLRSKPGQLKEAPKLPVKPKPRGYTPNVVVPKSSNKHTKPAKRSAEKQPQLKPGSGKKRKCSPSPPASELRPRLSQKTASQAGDASMFDSGVFMSPIEHVAGSTLVTPNLTPITTPSLCLAASVEHWLPAIELDSLLEPPLELSPVKTDRHHQRSPAKQPRLEPMELGSPLKSPIVEKTYGHRGMFMTPLERIEKKRKTQSKPRITTKRVDAWASKMNAEFEELEMYDLSID